MQKLEVPTSVEEGIESICVDLYQRRHLSLNELTSIGEGIKSYTKGQGTSNPTEDAHTTSDEPGQGLRHHSC